VKKPYQITASPNKASKRVPTPTDPPYNFPPSIGSLETGRNWPWGNPPFIRPFRRALQRDSPGWQHPTEPRLESTTSDVDLLLAARS
jgi:hypothetical protein